MKILFELHHPKHYYQFRYLINHYKKSDDILILARNKDVLLNLLEEENESYIILGKHGKGMVDKLLVLPQLLFNYWKIIRKFKPELMISKASIYAIFLKPFTRSRVIITPDAEVVRINNLVVAPLSDMVVTPKTFRLNYGKHHFRVDGLYEEAYLSPNYFKPDKSLVQRLGINPEEKYFLLRCISWDANHDMGKYGFKDSEKIELVNILKKQGQVYVSAERGNVPDELKQYLLKIPPRDIHQVLFHAQLYIGDSQTMATEAALLGTPSIRYNSFVGEKDMSNFIELEQKHQLMKNFNDFRELKKTLNEYLNDDNLKRSWGYKRDVYFKNKKDINIQLLDLFNQVWAK